MCSKKCAKPVRPRSTSSRDPVRTIDQKLTSPLLGIGTTISFNPLLSSLISTGKGMMPLVIPTLYKEWGQTPFREKGSDPIIIGL